MAVRNSGMKRKMAAKTAKTAARNPRLTRAALRAGFKVGKPVAKRRMRQRAERLGGTARTVGQTLIIYGPEAAYGLGLAERPKRKRTAPRFLAGAVIGGVAVYFLAPGSGPEHREQVAQLVG